MILDSIVIWSVWLGSKDGAYVCLALPTYFRLLFIATFLIFMLFNLHGFEWKTDYSVAGSPLKTLIRGEEIIPSHYDMISILCRRLTVQWPCQSPWIWLTFENIEWVRKNAFMNIDWSCQDRHNEGTDQILISTRCYPLNDTLQIRGTSTWTYFPATLPLYSIMCTKPDSDCCTDSTKF